MTGTGSLRTQRDYGRGVFSLETGRLNGHVPEDCNVIIGEKKVKTKAFALSHDKIQGSVFMPPTPPLFIFFFKNTFKPLLPAPDGDRIPGCRDAGPILHGHSFTRPGQAVLAATPPSEV